jgi:hypothetical protein
MGQAGVEDNQVLFPLPSTFSAGHLQDVVLFLPLKSPIRVIIMQP